MKEKKQGAIKKTHLLQAGFSFLTGTVGLQKKTYYQTSNVYKVHRYAHLAKWP